MFNLFFFSQICHLFSNLSGKKNVSKLNNLYNQDDDDDDENPNFFGNHLAKLNIKSVC